jgi:hypothetical protein
MRRTVRLLPSVAVLLLGVAASGCQQTFRSETVLHDDGSVERAVYQPASQTPAAAQRPQVWKQVTAAPNPTELEKQGWAGPIAHLPIRAPDKEKEYVAAWGDFKTVQDLPDHLVFKAPQGSGLPDSKLVRGYTRTDYVFLVEHRWRETLTDVVTLEDMRKAREELADFLIDVLSDGFDEAVGKDYDASTFFRSLRAEGKPWLAEMTDFLFVHCAAHKGGSADPALLDGLADICGRHGLVFKKEGQFLDDEAAGKALDEFVVGHICRGVRNKATGKPVDRETASLWWREFKGGDNPPPPLLKPALDRVIAAKYGGKDGFDSRCGALFARVFGVHMMDGVFRHEQLDYTLTVPGEVVESNGQLLAGNRVRWRFNAFAAYPLGYEMACRSLDARPQAQQDLLHGQPLKSREALVQFADVAAGLPGVADALQECRKQGKMAPLYEYRLKVARNPKTPVKPVNDLLKLLGLPEQPPEEAR